MDYLTFFGFTKKPFRSDLKTDEILVTEQLKNWQARFQFVTSHKLWGVLTGDVGAGKSTAIRWVIENLPHPEYKSIFVTAAGGSIIEIYRRILIALGLPLSGFKAHMFQTMTQSLKDIAAKEVTPILIIDEASLLSLEVFKELHTLTQFECDSKPILSVILVGQEDLMDKLTYPTSKPLASRITARMHLTAGNQDQTQAYVFHHLKIAGGKTSLFDETALMALHQASAGIPRNINNLARCALITATAEKRQIVTGEDVRVASTELFLHQ